MGKLNKQVVVVYQPDPIPLGDEAGAKKLARAINDLVKVVTWDESNEIHVTLRDHLQGMSKDLRSGGSGPSEEKPEKKVKKARRGRPPLSEEEKARRREAREAAKAKAGSGEDEKPKKRRGRPPGSKNKKKVEAAPKEDDKSNGSGVIEAPGQDGVELQDDLPLEVGADAETGSSEGESSTDGIF